MEIKKYQDSAAKTNQLSKMSARDRAQIILYGLAGEVGALQTCVKKNMRDKKGYIGFKSDMTEELGDILWYISAIADNYNISLDDAAQKNITRVTQNFSTKIPPFHPYDKGFPKEQQLPKKLTLEFRPDGKEISLYRNEQKVGDELTDNAYENDGYRFHDVFHMSYAAVLGWSPVLRRILKVKRKKSPKIDEVEDGARAALTEELISLNVYMSTNKHDLHRKESLIDTSVLHLIKNLVGGLEVNTRTKVEWGKAIRAGFEVFALLKKNNGGYVTYDMRKRSLAYSKKKPK